MRSAHTPNAQKSRPNVTVGISVAAAAVAAAVAAVTQHVSSQDAHLALCTAYGARAACRS